MKYNIRQMQIRSKLKNLCVKCGNILDHRASLKSGLDSLKLIQSRKSHLIGLPRNWCKNPGTLVWPLETKNNCSTRSSQNILINFVALTWQTTNLNYALICVRISAQFGKCVDLAIIMAENRNQIVDSDSPPQNFGQVICSIAVLFDWNIEFLFAEKNMFSPSTCHKL